MWSVGCEREDVGCDWSWMVDVAIQVSCLGQDPPHTETEIFSAARFWLPGRPWDHDRETVGNYTDLHCGLYKAGGGWVRSAWVRGLVCYVERSWLWWPKLKNKAVLNTAGFPCRFLEEMVVKLVHSKRNEHGPSACSILLPSDFTARKHLTGSLKLGLDSACYVSKLTLFFGQ